VGGGVSYSSILTFTPSHFTLEKEVLTSTDMVAGVGVGEQSQCARFRNTEKSLALIRN